VRSLALPAVKFRRPQHRPRPPLSNPPRYRLWERRLLGVQSDVPPDPAQAREPLVKLASFRRGEGEHGYAPVVIEGLESQASASLNRSGVSRRCPRIDEVRAGWLAEAVLRLARKHSAARLVRSGGDQNAASPAGGCERGPAGTAQHGAASLCPNDPSGRGAGCRRLQDNPKEDDVAQNAI
jgi:hypothetical protein